MSLASPPGTGYPCATTFVVGTPVGHADSAICTVARLLVAMPVVTLRGLDILHRLHQLRPRPARDRQRPDRLRPLPAGPATVGDSKRFAEPLACPDPVRHMSVNGRLAEHATVWCNYPRGQIERALGCGLLISSRRSSGITKHNTEPLGMSTSGREGGAYGSAGRASGPQTAHAAWRHQIRQDR
jgi:hypothetical protein